MERKGNIGVVEAARRLALSRQRVLQLIGDGKTGELKAELIGRTWVLRSSVVEAYRAAKLAKSRKAGLIRFDYDLDADAVESFLLACGAAGVDVRKTAAEALAEKAAKLKSK